MNAVFYISSAVAIVATFMVVTGRNAVHALLYLVVSLLAAGLMFFSLGAPFAAVLEVIIYAGAIMILFVFVIMTLNVGREGGAADSDLMKPSRWIGPAILCVIMVVEILFVVGHSQGVASGKEIVPKDVGVALLGPYLLGVELASILLMAALVGAFHLGRRDERVQDQGKDRS